MSGFGLTSLTVVLCCMIPVIKINLGHASFANTHTKHTNNPPHTHKNEHTGDWYIIKESNQNI